MKRVVLVAIALLFLSFAMPSSNAEARKFSTAQQKRVDTIYKVVSKPKNWKKYGCLPSVCIAQAFIESGVGQACRANNFWGLRCGRASYLSLEAGVYAYMKCINNGYYKGAPHQKNAATQISKILAGGYCQPQGAYYSKAIWTIKTYNLKKYDKKMFKNIKRIEKKKKEEKERKRKEKEKKRLQAKSYKPIFNSTLRPWEIGINKNIINGGTVLIRHFFFNVINKGFNKDNKLYMGWPFVASGQAVSMSVKFDKIWENAVG